MGEEPVTAFSGAGPQEPYTKTAQSGDTVMVDLKKVVSAAHDITYEVLSLTGGRFENAGDLQIATVDLETYILQVALLQAAGVKMEVNEDGKITATRLGKLNKRPDRPAEDPLMDELDCRDHMLVVIMNRAERKFNDTLKTSGEMDLLTAPAKRAILSQAILDQVQEAFPQKAAQL